MSLPTPATVAARCGLPINDPRISPALASAMSWARTTLCRPSTDPLADLNDNGNDATVCYAVDLLATESYSSQTQARNNQATASPDITADEISRRHAGRLTPGNQHAWSFA